MQSGARKGSRPPPESHEEGGQQPDAPQEDSAEQAMADTGTRDEEWSGDEGEGTGSDKADRDTGLQGDSPDERADRLTQGSTADSGAGETPSDPEGILVEEKHHFPFAGLQNVRIRVGVVQVRRYRLVVYRVCIHVSIRLRIQNVRTQYTQSVCVGRTRSVLPLGRCCGLRQTALPRRQFFPSAVEILQDMRGTLGLVRLPEAPRE